MKVFNYNYTFVVLLLFIAFMEISLQYHNIGDLPWQRSHLHHHKSDKQASNLATVTLNKNDEFSDVQKVTFLNSNLETNFIFNMLEQWGNISTLCHKTIEKFGLVSTKLIFCFVQNARPITVCQNCVEEYINFSKVYSNICISTDDKQMQECQSQILNKDKLNVIQKICDFTSSLWTNGYCTHCFKEDDGSMNTSLNSDTKKFLEIYKIVDNCFHELPSEITVHNAAAPKNRSVCSMCRKVYDSLCRSYHYLQHKYPDSVCMDLTDIMNTTRDLWSEHYHCVVMTASGIFVYILATIFSILVAAFYSGFRFIAHAQNTRIIGQKRFVTKCRSNSNSAHRMNSLQ